MACVATLGLQPKVVEYKREKKRLKIDSVRKFVASNRLGFWRGEFWLLALHDSLWFSPLCKQNDFSLLRWRCAVPAALVLLYDSAVVRCLFSSQTTLDLIDEYRVFYERFQLCSKFSDKICSYLFLRMLDGWWNILILWDYSFAISWFHYRTTGMLNQKSHLRER